MKKIMIPFAFTAIFSLLLIGCNKEDVSSSAIPDKEKTFQGKSDADFVDPSTRSNSARSAARTVIFTGINPNSIFANVTLTEASSLEVWAYDAVILDDVVEIYIDGCLVATFDSRGQTRPAYDGNAVTVTLPAGTHQVEYRNTISLTPGASAWQVAETIDAPQTIEIGGVDTGVPNFMVDCTPLQAMVDECAISPRNHGAYVSCVAHAAEAALAAGLITDAQKDILVSTAARSSIGSR